MASPEVLSRMEQRAIQAEQMIELLTKQISQLQTAVVDAQKDQLRRENQNLKQEVDSLKRRLVDLEKSQGIKQYYDFTSKTTPSSDAIVEVQPAANTSAKPPAAADKPQQEKPQKEKKEKKKAEGEKKGGGGGKKPEEEAAVDVSRLDFRVGRIVTAKKHPDADSLYVEEVDIAEGKFRTVVSGLVRFIPEAEMQNRMVVLLCNLKPAKMRGVLSEAMVMCASTPEKVEILAPPEGSQPGDLVEFEGYTRNPDAVLNPKKKIFETCAPDLKTDQNKVAVFKGIPFTVPGKGVVVAQTLANVQVK
ncbi:aminoacyl tRNA synthase complex-interacting multifunctional protein 1-like [Penaeus chinensis]|uniref:aminoacyl tRNA synthase complex-interacting multifunctional protein 1-like n=1 Tax=Penaeus chinensis TaxID=139456 RepID=UPI001FB78896|nr:aminoacyl tRNA synthase complex-interacting multifunctional protein 1-like [Penaeus chinensis]